MCLTTALRPMRRNGSARISRSRDDLDGDSPNPPSGTAFELQGSASQASLHQAVEDYYEAVDREDWDYTYDNLDSQSRQRFTREEWKKKNQWVADNEQLELSSLEIDTRMSPSGTTADVTVYRTFKDGSSLGRDTYFVYEDGSWKHQLTEEELALFTAGTSFEEFVKAQEGDSTDNEASQREEVTLTEREEIHTPETDVTPASTRPQWQTT